LNQNHLQNQYGGSGSGGNIKLKTQPPEQNHKGYEHGDEISLKSFGKNHNNGVNYNSGVTFNYPASDAIVPPL